MSEQPESNTEQPNMQKYILGASPDVQSAMIRPFDNSGNFIGDWQLFNAGIVYKADEADAQFAKDKERIAELEKALRDAIECVQDWSGYASEYFQEKHDLAGDLKRLTSHLQAKA